MYMICSNNHNQSGFLIPEVLVTIAIVGLVMTPIFILQSNALRGLYKISAQTQMLFPLQSELQEQAEKSFDRQEEEVTEQKTVANPAGRMSYKMRVIAPSSELKDISDLYYHEAQMVLPNNERESMVLFVYRPEQKKKK
jgi:hypothetical protein